MSLYWIDHPAGHRLAIMARPRAGDWLEDEIARWRNAGVDLVVSLLESEEVADLELQREAMLCRAAGIDFVSFPIPDRGVPPSFTETRTLTEMIGMRGGEHAVAIHCRAGIGRSALIAGMVLVLAGMSTADALDAIGRARGLIVPDTDAQIEWLRRFEHSRSA